MNSITLNLYYYFFQDNNNLLLLESLLNEFYSSNSTNTRKKEIEQSLNSFQNIPKSWEYCVNSLANFNNQYLWFFSVSSVEVIITKKWISLPKDDRLQIRDTIWKIYINFPTSIFGMQRDKIAQLLALIGKREFPVI